MINELVSAEEYAESILNPLRKFIAAKKILHTWRSLVIDREASKEREDSIKNKILNKILPIKVDHDIVNKNNKKISFKDHLFSKSKGGGIKEEPLPLEDGVHKSKTIFTNMLYSWLDLYDNGMQFFSIPHIRDNYVNDTTSIHWNYYLKELLILLNKKGYILLWGSKKKDYINKRHYKVIHSLQNHWNLFNLRKENEKLKKELNYNFIQKRSYT